MFLRCRSVTVSLPQQQLQPPQGFPVGRVQETEVAHLMDSPGQNVLEKAAQEFHCLKSYGLPLPGVGVQVTKRHMIVFQGNDAVICDGNPVNVAG